MNDSTTTEPTDRVLVITRLLDASPARVFQAWADREQAMQWWGPKDFTAIACAMDFRPGGSYRTCIRSPDGADHWMQGVYREIVPPERLVFTFAWEEDGRRGLETLVTVTFAAENGKTRLTFRQAVFESVESRDSHEGGWGGSFDRLQEYLTRD